MKHLFTEKYIRDLENNKKDRLEIYDSFCPYLGCRIGKTVKRHTLSAKNIWDGISELPSAKRTKSVWSLRERKLFRCWKRFKTAPIRTKKNMNCPKKFLWESSMKNIWNATLSPNHQSGTLTIRREFTVGI